MIAAIKEQISTLFKTYSTDAITHIDKIPQSGGDRNYFRIHCTNKTYIATFSNNVKENEAFLYFTNHFLKIAAPVPTILCVNNDKTIYIQQDFGNNALLSILEKVGYTPEVDLLYKKTLSALAKVQINGDNGLEYANCITSQNFGKQAILSDLLYFKYYFLDTLKIAYDKEKLGDDFETLSTFLNQADHKYFMYRDFQSRNIMIQHNEPFFIDYQGGMKGALQYDVASLLWQAKANLNSATKQQLLKYYISCVQTQLGKNIDVERFTSQYNGYVLIRLLQVLGAYGFRGLFEKKAHFLTSIPLALYNLTSFLQEHYLGVQVPEFEAILTKITEPQIINKFIPIRATATTPLVVHIKSFSFLKSGYPKNMSTNGGGFVFDCRGILNPGRIEQHKTETGRDKPVQVFLEEKTRMDEFLAGVYSVVDISVEDYINRNFEILEVNFGCTGGQHRSVYAADTLSRHLKNKYGVKTVVQHIEQNFNDK